MNQMSDYRLIDVTLMLDAFGALAELPNELPRHLDEDVEVAPNLRIGPIQPGSNLKSEIADACEPRGINWEPPSRNYPVSYAMYRVDPPDQPFFAWDPDQRLWTFMQLSRLVRPTSIAAGYAARLVYDSNGHLKKVMPAIDGSSSRCWVAEEQENWIRDSDIEPISDLVHAFDPAGLPERVLRGMWFHEFAHQQYFLNARWALISIGVEALVHTDERSRSKIGSTRQFVARTARLAQRIGAIEVDEEQLREIYERRSTIAHGQALTDPPGRDKDLYIILEKLLRTVLRSAILDPDLAKAFSSDDSIREAFA